MCTNPTELNLWHSGFAHAHTQKRRIYFIPKKTITIGNMGLCSPVAKSCATRWDVLFDGSFLLNTMPNPSCSYCSAVKKIWMLLTALLLCHLGFVHLRWPKYALSPVWPMPRSYRTLDQRIMHRLSLGLP